MGPRVDFLKPGKDTGENREESRHWFLRDPVGTCALVLGLWIISSRGHDSILRTKFISTCLEVETETVSEVGVFSFVPFMLLTISVTG